MRLRKPHTPIKVLNITPMIDVVFIILIFFMLTTKFAEFRLIGINTPKETTVVRDNLAAIVVKVFPGGTIEFDGDEIVPGTLSAQVAEVIALDPGRQFLIRPAAEVTLQDTINAYNAVEAGGARSLSFSRPTDLPGADP